MKVSKIIKQLELHPISEEDNRTISQLFNEYGRFITGVSNYMRHMLPAQIASNPNYYGVVRKKTDKRQRFDDATKYRRIKTHLQIANISPRPGSNSLIPSETIDAIIRQSHTNAKTAYRKGALPELEQKNSMPVRITKTSLSRDHTRQTTHGARDLTIEYDQTTKAYKARLRLRGRRRCSFFITTADVGREVLNVLHGVNGIYAGDPSNIIKKGNRYFLNLSATKTISSTTDFGEKVRIVGVDVGISEYVAAMFCISARADGTFSMVKSKTISSKKYMALMRAIDRQNRKKQSGRMLSLGGVVRGERYAPTNRLGDSLRNSVTKNLIGYITNQAVSFAQETGAEVIAVEWLKNLNDKLGILRQLKTSLGNLYAPSLHGGTAAVNSAIATLIRRKIKCRSIKRKYALNKCIAELRQLATAENIPRTILMRRKGVSVQNFLISHLPYFQLLQDIELEAKWNNLAFRQTSPKNTSRRCIRCGHTAEANRTTRSGFKCVKCGFEMNADTLGSANVAANAAAKILGLKSPPTLSHKTLKY